MRGSPARKLLWIILCGIPFIDSTVSLQTDLALPLRRLLLLEEERTRKASGHLLNVFRHSFLVIWTQDSWVPGKVPRWKTFFDLRLVSKHLGLHPRRLLLLLEASPAENAESFGPLVEGVSSQFSCYLDPWFGGAWESPQVKEVVVILSSNSKLVSLFIPVGSFFLERLG